MNSSTFYNFKNWQSSEKNTTNCNSIKWKNPNSIKCLNLYNEIDFIITVTFGRELNQKILTAVHSVQLIQEK